MRNILIVCLLFGFAYGGWSEDDLREDKNYAKDEWRAYSPYDAYRNPEILKKLEKSPKSHSVHQYVWVYTKEFAKRFAMPKRWIGKNDFKGALALAYRQEVKNDRWCGYFGDFDNCREFDSQCVSDVYVPHESKSIPWNTDAKMGRIYYTGAHSIRFLSLFRNTDYEKKKYTDSKGNLPSWYYEGEEGQKDYDNLLPLGKNSRVGIDSITWAHRFKSDGFGEGGGGTVRFFHRNILDGIDLITIQGMCNFASSGDGEMHVWLGGGDNEKSRKFREYNKQFKKNGFIRRHEKMKVSHKIYPGKSFMQRVKTYDETNSDKSFFEYFKKNLKIGNRYSGILNDILMIIALALSQYFLSNNKSSIVKTYLFGFLTYGLVWSLILHFNATVFSFILINLTAFFIPLNSLIVIIMLFLKMTTKEQKKS